MLRMLTLALAIAASGCAMTKGELRASGLSKTEYIAENYQLVYKNTLERMKACLDTGLIMPLSPVSMIIESELYPDLGQAELAYYQSNLANIYYSSIEIQQEGNGSRVTVYTGGQPEWANKKMQGKYFAWAKGENSCD